MSHDLRDLLGAEAIIDGTTKYEPDSIELPLHIVSISASFFGVEPQRGHRRPCHEQPHQHGTQEAE